MFQACNQTLLTSDQTDTSTATGTVGTVSTWYDYRSVWARHPWVLIYAVFVALLIVVSIIGTFAGDVFAILFIPSLAGVYVHHIIVMRKLDQHA